MKLLLIDFLRRWWGLYLTIFLILSLVEAIEMSFQPHARAEFLVVGFFTFPLWFDLARGSVGVTTTLPVSRKTLGLYYFVLTVCVPVILLMLVTAVATQVFNAAIVFSWTDFVFVALGALVAAGTYSLLGSFRPAEMAGFANMIWYAALFGSIALETSCHDPWAWLGLIFLGLPATAWAFVRSEKLIVGRARNRPDSTPKARKAILPARHSAVRPPSPIPFFADRIRTGFVAAVILAVVIVFCKWKANQNLIFGMGMFLFVGSFPIWGGLRLIRTLPLSTNHLALWLLLTPLCILAPVFLVFAVLPVFAPGDFSPARVASLLILAAGTGSLPNGFSVRFGLAGGYASMTLLLLSFVAVANEVPIASIPAIVGWLLGLALYCVGFFLMRRGLCCSDSYQARKDTVFS